MTPLLAAVYDGGRSFVPAFRLGSAVEFVDAIPRQELGGRADSLSG
jgi:hypothetical protein